MINLSVGILIDEKYRKINKIRKNGKKVKKVLTLLRNSFKIKYKIPKNVFNFFFYIYTL